MLHNSICEGLDLSLGVLSPQKPPCGDGSPQKPPRGDFPTAAPASLNVHVVSTNFAKTSVSKREYVVILWRHKRVYPVKRPPYATAY